MFHGYRLKNVGVATLVVVLGTLGTVLDVRAGISYELIFRSTGANEVAFGSVEEARSATVVSDLIMTTTDALIGHSVSVGFDNDRGLSAASATEWSGVAVGSFMMQPVFHRPIAPGVVIGPSSISSFDAVTPPPSGPPSLSPGTYNIGTIIWDTTAIRAGVSTIFPFLTGPDGTGAVLPAASNNIVSITGTEVLVPSLINVVPEPATAGLLAMGLLGLLLARRRSG